MERDILMTECDACNGAPSGMCFECFSLAQLEHEPEPAQKEQRKIKTVREGFATPPWNHYGDKL